MVYAVDNFMFITFETYAGEQLCLTVQQRQLHFVYKTTRIILSLPAISNDILLIYIAY